MKKSFILYLDQYEPIQSLTDKQKGILFDALFVYQSGKEPVLKDQVIKMAFGFFKQTFERDRAKYLKRCEKNRENINKRWNKEDTNVYERIRTNTKHTDSDSVSDNESESDIKKKKYKKKKPIVYSNEANFTQEEWEKHYGSRKKESILTV
jgi:hypothetical protein